MTKEVHISERRQFLKLGGTAALLAATGGLPSSRTSTPGSASVA